MGSTTANGVVDKGVDFANYFCTYGFLYHQKDMLCDRVRMDSYFNAVFKNKHHFQGKVQTFLKKCSDFAAILWYLVLIFGG